MTGVLPAPAGSIPAALPEAASWYAARGWAIFPLVAGGKEPLTEHGFRDATPDPETVASWWRRWPASNIGWALRIGDARCAALDEDEPGALAGWCATHDVTLPATAEQATPRGGRHVVYDLCEAVATGQPELCTGVDTRTRGHGYLAIEPSVIGGRAYRWRGDPEAIAEAPEALIRHWTAPRPERPHVAGDNGRATLADLGFMVAAAELAPKLRELWAGRLDGYPSQSEADLGFCSLLAHRGADPGRVDRLMRASGLYRPKWEREDYRTDTLGLAFAGTGEPPTGEQIEPGTGLPAGFDFLSDVLSRDQSILDPIEVVVPYLAVRGRSVVLAGPQKSGKSSLVGCAASRVTRGGSFLGGRCSEGVVLWVGFEEQDADIAGRIERFQGDPARIIRAIRPPDTLRAVEAVISSHPVVYVVLDSLRSLARHLGVKSLWDGSEMTDVVLGLTDLCRTGSRPALQILHHTPRKEDRFADSGAIGGMTDANLCIERIKRGSDRRSVVAEPSRMVGWAQDFSYAMDSDLAGFTLDAVATGAASELGAAVLRFVAQHEGASLRTIRDAVGARNEDVAEAVGDLIHSGKLADEGAGNRRKLRLA